MTSRCFLEFWLLLLLLLFLVVDDCGDFFTLLLLIELWTDELASVVVVVTDENNTVLPVPFSGMVFVCDMLLSGVEMKADPPTMALAQATRCKPRKSMFGEFGLYQSFVQL